MPDRSSAPPDAGFRLLLSRLGTDDERAGVSFERIRRGLIKFFDWRGASWPEECADMTLDRLARKIEQGVAVVDVAAFAYGIARLVLQEALRSDARRESLDVEPPVDSLADPSEREALYRHLEICLGRLPEGGRELVLAYYAAGSGRSKIQSRRRLAHELRLSDNALRSRVQRLRERLEECVRMSAAEDERGSGSQPSNPRHVPPGDDTIG